MTLFGCGNKMRCNQFIRLEGRSGKPTDDNYKRVVLAKVSLEELIKFANKKIIQIQDITERINQEKARTQREETYSRRQYKR